MFSILVTCKPCSDEEVLMAVCTSDFGKYTQMHTLKEWFDILGNTRIAYTLSCRELDEKIDTAHMSVC